MPSHRAAPGLNLTLCVPSRVSRLHRLCFRRFEKRMASVLDSSNRTAFLSAHSRLVAAHRTSFLTTSSTSVPSNHVTSSTYEIPRLSSTWSSTASWMSAMSA